MSATHESAVGPASVSFRVLGLPVAQGSKTAFRAGDRTLIVDAKRAALGPWREAIASVAAEAISEPYAGPVLVELNFVLPRPKSHFGTGANAGRVKAGAPFYVATRPDVDKLARAVCDALTGIAFRDDAQVAVLHTAKRYGEPPAVYVRVRTLPDP